MKVRRPVAVLALLCLLIVAAPAEARRFYVDPAGSNLASGHSPAAAWRTVGRVNRAALRPGDVVAFRAGSVFSDAQLVPRRSGTSVAPIRFTSFGRGEATLARGIWFASIAWIGIDHLRISGVTDAIASGYGSGARHVAISDDVISNVRIAVNSTNPSDDAWTISRNRIADTRDSGVVVEGEFADISGNQITNTGTDLAIPYDKHGIYSKSAHARIMGNRIVGFQAQGISTRFADAFISDNFIAGGDAGVGYWQQDRTAGTTVICGNTIARVRYGVLLGPESGPARERFRIFDNHIETDGGPAVYAPSGRPVVHGSRNVVTAGDALTNQSLAGARPCQESQATQPRAIASGGGHTSTWAGRGLYGVVVIIIVAGAGAAKALRTQRGNRLTQAG